MAIYFRTKTPRKLLNRYKKAIDDGHVITWQYNDDGEFTHTADQWIGKAWLRPKIEPERMLTINIISPENQPVNSAVYAVYHGRFLESMLRHCDQLFNSAEASSLAEDDDDI